MKSNLVDVDVEIHHETDLAWLVSTDGDREKAAWVPKSQGEMYIDGTEKVLTCPEWLAHDKGLI